jgi:hypothetical protein
MSNNYPSPDDPVIQKQLQDLFIKYIPSIEQQKKFEEWVQATNPVHPTTLDELGDRMKEFLSSQNSN